MNKSKIKISCSYIAVIIFLLSGIFLLNNEAIALPAMQQPSTSINKLRVQSLENPLAIEDKHPLFSWQMESSEPGQKQTAYQIVVTRETDDVDLWNTGKVESGMSNNIQYMGVALQPEMAYSWELTVWDAHDQPLTETSRFETGLMNPKQSAWEGAEFIGTNELTLDATSHYLFEINTDFQIIEGNSASIVLGADDFRFSDEFLNFENVEGENYVRLQLDVSGVGTEEGAALNIYRVGYGQDDSPDEPYMAISSETYPGTNLNEIITTANANQEHNLSVSINAGDFTITIDGTQLQLEAPPEDAGQGGFGGFRRGGPSVSISNYSTGNNYNTYPNLNSVGFAAEPGSEVVFSNYKILNIGQSNPNNNVVFDGTTRANYSIFEDLEGVSVNVANKSITVENSTDELLVGYADPSHGSLTMTRTEFSTDQAKEISKAKVYVTAMGAYEMFINGQRVGNDWFPPGDTQFRETLAYYAYDVTDMVTNGENAVGAILNPAWYTGYMTFSPRNFNFFGDTEALLAKLVITYEDGSEEVIVTDDETWRIFKEGPIEYGSFFQGERYNANKEESISVNDDITGWATTAYNDSQWEEAEIVEPRDWINFDIVARYDRPVRVVETLQARQVMEINSEDEHTYTYDMGVNMVGVPSVTIPAGWLQEGDVVIFRYGEQVIPGLRGDDSEYVDYYGYGRNGKGIAGRIQTETYRAALSTDFYVAKGSDEVKITPTTTYRGYQYIEIRIPGHEGPLPLENVEGLVLSSDELPTGEYVATTEDEITGQQVNQLFTNIQRSQLGNFFTIPTDCPQRNERMGWTGDAQAYTRTGTYNSDARNFFRQWMVALRDDQGVGSATEAPGGIGSTVPTYNTSDAESFADGTTWAGAVCMVPWQLYIQYGDKQIIEENMETMMAWLNGMDFYDFSDEYTYLSAKTTGLADWLAPDSNTPANLLNNAIYIYLMEVTAEMAKVIGEDEYAAILEDRHEKAKAEWNDLYVDPESGRTRNANGDFVHSQSSYATPLNFNAFSDEYKERAQYYLAELAANPNQSNQNPDGSRVEYTQSGGGGFGGSSSESADDFLPYTITTGFSGTPNILPALSRGGKVDEAYSMFTCKDYPSWLYPVSKGATSIWERWNGYEAAFGENNQNSMNSFNHFALGAVGQWMYEYQLGITSDHINGQAGYKEFVLQPTAGAGFTSLEGSYDSNYGTIESSWTADGEGNITSYRATVPANTTATLYLPVTDVVEDFDSSEWVNFVEKTTRNNLDVAKYELASGTYEFQITGSAVIVSTLY